LQHTTDSTISPVNDAEQLQQNDDSNKITVPINDGSSKQRFNKYQHQKKDNATKKEVKL
ncbi:3629_t:CDS:1, partial [Dentiscutata erythropus]